TGVQTCALPISSPPFGASTSAPPARISIPSANVYTTRYALVIGASRNRYSCRWCRCASTKWWRSDVCWCGCRSSRHQYSAFQRAYNVVGTCRSELEVGDKVAAGQTIGSISDDASHCDAQCVHWGVRMPDAWKIGSTLRDLYIDPAFLLGWSEPSILWPVHSDPT